MIAARQIAFGKAAGAKKPYDAEIEYLESTGTQYIDTGFKANTITTRLEASIEFTDPTSPQGVFGSRNKTTEGHDSCNAFILASNIFRPDWAAGGGVESINITISPNTIYEMSITRGSLTMNGVVRTYDKVGGPHDQNFNFLLFSCSNAGSVFPGGLKGRLRYAKIYSNDILVRDLIPVRVGNVGYMYDRVSGQLFGNQGTGEFVLGPDITDIDYTAKDYIQDGLVAMWDGIENVGFGEPHDSSATTWKNLVGDNDIEIYTQNAEWNDSALVGKERPFVNASTVLGLGTLAMPSTYETVEVVINSYDNSRTWVLFMHGSPMSTSHVALASHTRGLQFAYVSGLGGGIYIGDLPTEGVRFGAARVGTSPSQEGGECYLNGLPYTRGFSRSNLSSAARFGEGFRTNESNAAPFVGEVCAMRFYNRALTADEIAYNYNIDKARFNI